MVASLLAILIALPLGVQLFGLGVNRHFLAYGSLTSSMVSASTFGNITVYFFDVGQGDSILINADDKNVLIDGGPKTAGSTLLGYLSSVNVTHIDVMVATHPHEDHIGGLITVMQSTLTIDMIFYNGQNHTSQTFQEFMSLAQEHTLTVAGRNEVCVLTATTNFTILNPVQPLEFVDINANSVVLKLQVNNVSFLFTGDAAAETEQSMINEGLSLRSDVLKVAHHGSRTSTSQAFLDAVNPNYAVISAGLDNTYGHPHEETVQRLLDKGVITYGTYASGTIVFTTDGNTVTVQGSPEPIPEFPSAIILPLLMSLMLVAVVLAKKRTPRKLRI
jgi:beta-lactamase superfamily II metal-dependent hydrolase